MPVRPPPAQHPAAALPLALLASRAGLPGWLLRLRLNKRGDPKAAN
jgi:hypothetical protein